MYCVSEIRLLLIDSNCMMREGLAALFGQEPNMTVVGNSDGGSEALELVAEAQPNVVVVSISPGVDDGMEIVRHIAQQHTEIRIVALSSLCNKGIVAEAFRAGVHAYVVKRNSFGQLLRAIHTVLSGATHLCTYAREIVIEQYRDGSDDEDTPSLTDRESVVLQFIGEGRTSKEIALHMDLSSKTIDACRRQLMRKLGVDSIAGLVKHAIVMGLTTSSP